MSETPRTDAESWKAGDSWEEKDEVVDADFARTLERELTDERAHADRLAVVVGEMLDCGLEGPRKQDIEAAIEALTAHEARRKGGKNNQTLPRRPKPLRV